MRQNYSPLLPGLIRSRYIVLLKAVFTLHPPFSERAFGMRVRLFTDYAPPSIDLHQHIKSSALPLLTSEHRKLCLVNLLNWETFEKGKFISKELSSLVSTIKLICLLLLKEYVCSQCRPAQWDSLVLNLGTKPMPRLNDDCVSL